MVVAARPSWTGSLRISLVTIPVRLYTATSERHRIRFHQIHAPSGERVRYQNVVPGIGPVERDEIVKGYEYERGRYVTVDPDDLGRLRLDTSETIDVVQFVEAGELDPVYLDSPYYLMPEDSLAEEGYRVLREALSRARKIALGQVVLSGRERIVAISPYDDGLLLDTLHYADEIRQPADFFHGLGNGAIDEEQLALMAQIVAKRTRAFAPQDFVDHYEEALQALIEEKLAGRRPEKPAERQPARVVNLMDALKRSVAEQERAKPPAGRRGGAQRRRRKSATNERAQHSLLLPVEGGRGRQGRSAKPASEPQAKPTRRRRKA